MCVQIIIMSLVFEIICIGAVLISIDQMPIAIVIKTKTLMLPSCFQWIFLKAVASAGAANSLMCAFQKSNPGACVPVPYWTKLRQRNQQLRTLMIWTHWGLVICAHRLSARSPINISLLKFFATQHKSILFCLRLGSLVKYVEHISIFFFPIKAENDWLICMFLKKKKLQWFGIIRISVPALIFIRDAFCLL